MSGCFDVVGPAVPAAATTPDTGNAPPAIQGIPAASIKVGDFYDFQPSASDPDGDSLTFSISGKPDWANFDQKSGDLSGMPLLGSEGVYNGIVITASDGKDTTSLEFSVTVTTIGFASITLTWTPPTRNEDGTVLTDLAGYRIYYGSREGNYPNSIELDNPGMATYVIDNLTPQTYYFVATSFNSMGIESDYSNVAAIQANL
jgi:hypothetical protein